MCIQWHTKANSRKILAKSIGSNTLSCSELWSRFQDGCREYSSMIADLETECGMPDLEVSERKGKGNGDKGGHGHGNGSNWQMNAEDICLWEGLNMVRSLN